MNLERVKGCPQIVCQGVTDNYLTKYREAAGLNQNALAKLINKPRQYIHRIESGETKLAAFMAKKIAPHLNVTPEQLLFGPQSRVVKGDARILEVPVLGKIAAGTYIEIDGDISSQEDPRTLPAIVETRWPDDAVFFLEVEGNSINRKARHGEKVLCLEAGAAPRSAKEDDWVVVERRRAGVVETTVKQLRQGKRGMELWPDSDDPKWQQPIPMKGDKVHDVIIRGFVLQFPNPGTKF